MRMRTAVETLWAISRRTRRSASRSTRRNILKDLANPGFLLCPPAWFQLTVNYICVSKNDAADSVHHRQIREEVYTHQSVSSLRNSPRRFRMAIQAHLVELERKHKTLENELHEALIHLSTDDLQIAELKRRKLLVKDEIERLRHSADETVH